MNDDWNMLGHEWAVIMLRRHIRNGTTRHAYLFTGPPCVGRRTLALRFAQAMNCTNPPETGTPCQSCRDCTQIARMQHPDLFTLRSETGGGALKVEQIRELQRSLALAAYQSRYRIALLLNFEEATESAANALLKTLEEAPAHIILLLTADDPSRLLPTITSRCEIFRLHPMTVSDMEKHLLTQGIKQPHASLCSHISGGRPGYACRLLNDPALLESRREQLADLQNLVGASRIEKFAYAENLAKDRDHFRGVLLVWLSFWRDVWLTANGSNSSLINIDMAEEIEKLSKQTRPAAALHLLKEHKQALDRLERFVNARLLAENLLLALP